MISLPELASGPGPTIRDKLKPQTGPRLSTTLKDLSSPLVRNPSARTENGNVKSLADRFDSKYQNPTYYELHNAPKIPDRSGSRMSRDHGSMDSLNNIINEMQNNALVNESDNKSMIIGMPKPERKRNISESHSGHRVRIDESFPPPPNRPVKETSIDDIPAELERQQKNHPMSSWLNEKLEKLNNDNWKAICPPTKSIGTDTFELKLTQDNEINQLKSRVSELECSLSIKSRELETNQYIEKELRRKLSDAEELFDVRRRLEDTVRHYDEQVRMNQELTDENAKLMDQIGERNRRILQYQAELDNLERIITSKNALNEEGLRRKLEEEIRALSDGLQQKAHALAISHKEITMVHAEVRKKEKEIELRDNRIDSLLADMRMLTQKMNEAETNHAQALSCTRSLNREKSILQSMIDKKEPFNSVLEKLQFENSELKNYIDELEKKNKMLESSRDLAHQLSQELKEFQSAISDKNLAHMEKEKISETLGIMEKMLREKQSEEESLRKELKSVQDYIYELERENNEHRQMETVLKSNNELLIRAETARVDLARKLAGTQRKWARLSSACIERNMFLNDLLKECFSSISSMNQSKADALIHEELPIINSKNEIEDIPEDWLQPANGNTELRLNPKVKPALKRDVESVNKIDPSRFFETIERPEVRSVKAMETSQVRKDSYLNPEELYDYIGSGHRYSDWLAKVAKVDQNRNQAPSPVAKNNGGPLFDESLNLTRNASRYEDYPDTSITEGSMEKFQRPSPPRDIRGRLVSDDDWLIEWSPPLIDENEISNGFKVAGYRLVINGHEISRVASPWLCKALIKLSSIPTNDTHSTTDAHLHDKICVQTVAITGHLSRPSPAKIENSDNIGPFINALED